MTMKKIEKVFNTESIPSNDEYIDKVNDTKAFNLILENQFECFDVLRKKVKSIKIASIQILDKLKSNPKSNPPILEVRGAWASSANVVSKLLPLT